MSIRILAAAACAALLSLPAAAAVQTKEISYEQGGKTMKGYLAWDDAHKGARPGVLVVHEWWGLNDYTKMRTRQLAEMGYVAFAADMFGDGATTRDPKQAQAWYSSVADAQGLMAARSKAGLDILRQQKGVDTKHLAAIGFCFGGTTVLRLAYSGEPLDAVVSFHGGLVAPSDAEAKAMKTHLLVLHGNEDHFIKPETIESLKKTLDANNVDWYMVTYAHAVHAFTNPDADSFKIPGIGYNKEAATRSWDEMQRFSKEEMK
ncbi:MAG TPA: dienelactone hydrolase family protein [Usitatibacter sp.]|nr:dienelactone hydrolase family protein [Usitatibacter sp.]